MAKAGRKRSYESYKNQYNAKKRQLAANGIEMNQRLLSKAEFDAQYNRILNRRKSEVTLGKRKTTGNITRDIVNQQAFALSAKQAEALLKQKPNISYYQARSGIAIDIAYNEYKYNYELEHPDDISGAAKAAAAYISTEYFGS